MIKTDVLGVKLRKAGRMTVSLDHQRQSTENHLGDTTPDTCEGISKELNWRGDPPLMQVKRSHGLQTGNEFKKRKRKSDECKHPTGHDTAQLEGLTKQTNLLTFIVPQGTMQIAGEGKKNQ